MTPYGAFAPGGDPIQLNGWMQPFGDTTLYDDFLYGNQAVGSFTQVWNPELSGGALTFPIALSNVQGHPGIMLLDNAGAAANKIGVNYTRPSAPNQVLENGYWSVIWLINLQTLIGANTYNLRVGMGDNVTAGAEHNNGVYFDYSNASVNWQLKAANGGVRTTVDSGVVVAAATWLYLGVRQNVAQAGIATYSINGVDVGQVTTNVPTANPVCQAVQMLNTAGIGSVPLWIDACYWSFAFNAAR